MYLRTIELLINSICSFSNWIVCLRKRTLLACLAGNKLNKESRISGKRFNMETRIRFGASTVIVCSEINILFLFSVPAGHDDILATTVRLRHIVYFVQPNFVSCRTPESVYSRPLIIQCLFASRLGRPCFPSGVPTTRVNLFQ